MPENMLKITSRDNQKLKTARKARDGKDNSLIFIEGTRLVEEALRSGVSVSECFVSESFAAGEHQQILNEIAKHSISVNAVSDQIFNSLSDTKSSQGIALTARKPETGKDFIESVISGDFAEFPFLVLLHRINNPSNLGAILRTCEAVGIKGAILTKNSADVFSPKSLRAAMGAAFRLKFWTNADFDEALEFARQQNLSTICADINSKENFWEFDWKQPSLLAFGSEAHGLTAEERQKIGNGIYVPMENDVESLNLAVSCGIILYEVKRNWTK